MISIPAFPPVAYLPRPILEFAYTTITDRLPVFLAKAPYDGRVALSNCIAFISSCDCVHDSRPERRKASLLANPCDHLTLMIRQN
jgi:hypothetical protein